MNSIKERRLERNYTLDQVAALIGVDKSTVSLWENGKKEPRVNAIMRLADLFGCSVEELMRPIPMEEDNAKGLYDGASA